MRKDGMTFLTVMVAVVIMLIFASTVTIAAVNISNNSKKNKFATEIAFVQESVNNYFDKNNEYPIEESVNVNLASVNSNDKTQFESEENYSTNVITLYKIDLSKLGKIEVVYGNGTNAQDIYAVSKTTGKVYYLEGVQVSGTTYFTLTDDLKNIINYVDTNEETITKDGISFISSTLEWTNKPVSTRVLVPNKYTNVTIVAKKEGASLTFNVSDSISIDSFNEYIVNGSDSSKEEGNYSILVSYQKMDDNNQLVSYNQTYSVTNFDNDFPKLVLSDKQEMISNDGKEEYRYIRVEEQSDALSGIKYIKYERENISDEDAVIYFKNNGIELQGDIIEYDKNTKYLTVYIEDNAGNYTLVRKDLLS